jgi:hypothetical protein
MAEVQRASQRITEIVGSWSGVEAGPGPRGEFGFRVGSRELGHLHGDYVAHFSFPAKVGQALKDDGRVVDHPVFPGKPGFAARAMRDQADVDDVIELMRLNYDRILARGQTSTSSKIGA